MHPSFASLALLMAASLTQDVVTGGVAVAVGLLAAWLGQGRTPEERCTPFR